jgi:4-hydroxy-tetrahydrodipicolinate synthase
MLNIMGLIENQLRLPLVPARITTLGEISAIVKELNIKC